MSSLWLKRPFRAPHLAVWGTAVLAFLAFLSTLQITVNGSNHPYVTDVGEIQNALPRWGTIHFTGYPQFTALGSLFVTIFRGLGLAPAAAGSLYAAVWGAVTIGLLVYLLLLLEIRPLFAASTALLLGLSTSFWVDASIAEIHTLTMALTVATLIAAIRWQRTGSQRDLYWLAFLTGQGLAHQRAFVFLGLGLLVLVMRQWRQIWQRLPAILGLALLGPLTYIYLPLRAWMGADWTFNSPGTWSGFWSLFLDTKTERIVEMPGTAVTAWARLEGVFNLLVDDMTWPLLLLGLVGLWLPLRQVRRSERFSFRLVVLAYLALSFIIWIGRVGEAVLAAKLPIVAMAIIGLAFWSQWLWQRWPRVGQAAVAVWATAAVFLFISHRPVVMAVTRDPGAERIINMVAHTTPAADGRPVTFMALWGNDYWQLAYAQAYEDQFPHVTLVDHDTNFGRVAAEGQHVWTLSQTLYQRPLDWWQDQLGEVHLTAVAPGVVELRPAPTIAPLSTPLLLLDNNIAIQEAQVAWLDEQTLRVDVNWQAVAIPTADYSIAIHLVTQDPPTGPQDIAAQADSASPVDGWYPTSRWVAGEMVQDAYAIPLPATAAPTTARIGMYLVTADGQFLNSGWLSLPIPGKP
ncbi:MAG: DUF2723 domain-containing protein [Ardenticatenaceae bacterium]|nr:DUF2723 domain-containing protein [Ardenticatenaceae bacterium]